MVSTTIYRITTRAESVHTKVVQPRIDVTNAIYTVITRELEYCDTCRRRGARHSRGIPRSVRPRGRGPMICGALITHVWYRCLFHQNICVPPLFTGVALAQSNVVRFLACSTVRAYVMVCPGLEFAVKAALTYRELLRCSLVLMSWLARLRARVCGR